MSKQLECQRFIFKIHSSRLREAKWKLTLTIEEARKNEEVISLASSQVLRWIDELNGITDANEAARAIKESIDRIRREENSLKNRRAIKQLYKDLDAIQFKADYMCLIIDKEKDYHKACKGFSINGVNYVRLLGTNGGIKNSTIVFVSERLAPELRRRIENGRNESVPLVPAKFEAYKALTCSASTPVSLPNGLLVVKDCETVFKDNTIYLDDECDGEPTMTPRPEVEIKLDASDGFGLMLPCLAERWSQELQLDYTACGFNTRFSFEKGMVYAFDFISFARDIADNYIVKDVWGNEVDIRDVELILTESMLKLWDSYDSCDDYLENCENNRYTFGVAKVCPKQLEDERHLNYQFIQSYNLNDEEIEELISPTINEFKDVLSGDWSKAVLFLRGTNINENNIASSPDDITKAMMINHNVYNDPFVRSYIYQTIKHRIEEAKVGVIKVHGNYSIASGDPYALCQSIFGLEVTGLLSRGQIYNKHWVDNGADNLACFRAPMTCHNNIRLVHPCSNPEIDYWYQYMTTCTIFNAWDTCMAALNGMDFDGDLVMLTDNNVLVSKHRALPTIMCVQRKAAKKIPTEEDIITSNINSFGNDIGKITNWITSMFEVQSHFDEDSEEYKTLEYRIKCGQLQQQNAIDKAKGIISKPMPKEWHDRHSCNIIQSPTDNKLYRSIVADKKPYFMCYIYPDLMRKYKKFIKNTDRNAMRDFGLSVNELRSIPYGELTDRQKDFLYYYEVSMPVGIGDCVMNKICRRFEEEFDNYFKEKAEPSEFDYRILKSNASYTDAQYRSIKLLYDEYNTRLRSIAITSTLHRWQNEDIETTRNLFKKHFIRSCQTACSNSATLCNIILDICYKRSNTKKFAWDMCGSEIIKNLLRSNNLQISFPVEDKYGDIEYCGKLYKIHTGEIYI